MTNAPRDPRIISIHSAKGGVGKTLTALYLSHILTEDKESNNRVIIFDLDFCGTTMPDLSSLLAKDGSPRRGFLNPPDFVKDEKDKDRVNMLNLFKAYLEYSRPDEHDKHYQKLLLKYVVESGSNSLFIPSGSFHSDPTFTPMLLFDQLFSQAFCDFILDICRYISGKINEISSNQQIYFILDNPPGQNQLTPSLTQTLIEFGIDKAKMLFMSSPDEMDIDATVTNLTQISLDLYKNQEYLRALNDISECKPNFNTIDYFHFSWSDLFSKFDGNEDISKQPQALNEAWFKETPFLALVINRKMGNYRTNPESFVQEVTENAISSFHKALSRNGHEGIQKDKLKAVMADIFGNMPISMLPFDVDTGRIYQTRFYMEPEEANRPKSSGQNDEVLEKACTDRTGSDSQKEFDVMNLNHIIKMDAEIYSISILKKNGFPSQIVGEINIVIFSHILRSLKAIYTYLNYIFSIVKFEDTPSCKLSPENYSKLTMGIIYRLEEGNNKSIIHEWDSQSTVQSLCHTGSDFHIGDIELDKATKLITDLVEESFNGLNIQSPITFSFKVLLSIAVLKFLYTHPKESLTSGSCTYNIMKDSLELFKSILIELSKSPKYHINHHTILSKVTSSRRFNFNYPLYLKISFSEIIREIIYLARSFNELNAKHRLLLSIIHDIRLNPIVSENSTTILRMISEALYLGGDISCEDVESIWKSLDIRSHGSSFLLQNKFFHSFRNDMTGILNTWWRN